MSDLNGCKGSLRGLDYGCVCVSAISSARSASSFAVYTFTALGWINLWSIALPRLRAPCGVYSPLHHLVPHLRWIDGLVTFTERLGVDGMGSCTLINCTRATSAVHVWFDAQVSMCMVAHGTIEPDMEGACGCQSRDTSPLFFCRGKEEGRTRPQSPAVLRQE
jgi:hypothetical protein